LRNVETVIGGFIAHDMRPGQRFLIQLKAKPIREVRRFFLSHLNKSEKMSTRIFLSVFLTLCIVGCISRLNQSYEELSSDTFYRQSGGYGYIKSSSQSHATIFPKVVRYVFNGDYILVVQNPDSLNLRSMVAGELNTGKEKFSDLLKAADSLIANDPYYKKHSCAGYQLLDNRQSRP